MSANKLNKAGKRLVVSRIIAGDTNNEIRLALKDAGYPFDLVDSSFAEYRQNPEVKEAMDRKDSEALQSGYAQRSERILKLARSAKRLERLLAVNPEDPAFTPSKPLPLVMVHREYRDTLKDISDLVDPVKSQRVEVTGKDGNALTIEYVHNWRPAADTSALPPPGADRGEDAGEAI